MAEEQYQDYKDYESKSTTLKKIPDTKIILFILVLIFVGVIYLQSINFSFKEYWWMFAFGAAALYILSLKQSTQNIEYIKIDVAREILLQELNDYHVMGKNKKMTIKIPRGDFQMGMYHNELNPRISDPQMWLFWEIGFVIYDRDDNHVPKYFLGWVDSKAGGLGVLYIKELDSSYNGPPVQRYLTREVVVTPEKYAELKMRKGAR